MDSRIQPVNFGPRTLYRVGPCFFSSLRAAAQAVQAAQSHRLDLLDVFARFRASVASVATHTRN